jgi:hypothetical protein
MEISASTKSLNINNIINRCKLVILSPKQCWQTIAQETHTPQDLLRSIIIPLLVLGIVCSTIGLQVFGMNLGPLGTWRPPLFQYLISQVAFGMVSIAMIFVSSLILQKLAVFFQGSVSKESAFSLIAHSMLPIFVGNLLAIYPLLGIFGIVFTAISLVALYHGAQVMTTVSSNKTLGFIAAFIVSMILTSIIIYGVLGFMVSMPQPPL